MNANYYVFDEFGKLTNTYKYNTKNIITSSRTVSEYIWTLHVSGEKIPRINKIKMIFWNLSFIKSFDQIRSLIY